MLSSYKGTTPRWVIFLMDLFLSIVALYIAFQLRFNFNVPDFYQKQLLIALPYFVAIKALCFFVFRTYTGMIRFTGLQDSLRLFAATFMATIILGGTNFVWYYFVNGSYLIPFNVIIIEFLLSLFLVIVYRLGVKLAFYELKSIPDSYKKIVIFGAGSKGIITMRTLKEEGADRARVVGFIDDNKRKVGKSLDNARIYHTADLEALLRKNEVDELVIAIENLPQEKKQKVIETCLVFGVKVSNVPPFKSWIDGELNANQIKEVKIDDLLGRNEIELDLKGLSDWLDDKVVLVTGAAGSIGSEIVRQLLAFSPKKIIMLDQAESQVYELELELSKVDVKSVCEALIADVSNRNRMAHVFQQLKPQILFHAAAYKHVPLMENNPAEAIRANVLGTVNTASLSNEYGVEKFVMISTDKAVNPTNVMGASKRIAEIYVQSLNRESNTQFITTRFGNVLGSNGSVIPLFKRQLESGGPLTVTHPEITRYFMTIPEACQLVLEAGRMGDGGEIFVFDMGKAVKIDDLARNMIRLSGLIPDKDIEIVYTGLREGEKLYEELLNVKEITQPTHNKQILIGKVREYEFKTVSDKILSLCGDTEDFDNYQLVKGMKDIVPEFKSQNSVYSSLD